MIPTGLTSTEVQERIRKNLVHTPTDRVKNPFLKIFIRNFFTFYNAVIYPIVIVLAFLGYSNYVFILLFFAILNSVISTIQEIRAFLRLRSLSFQHSPTVHVIREKKEVEMSIFNIVKDDIIKFGVGDSIPVDGRVIESNYLQVDESLLTGESAYINKKKNDELLSGSFVVAGSSYMQVTKIGKESYGGRFLQEASQFSIANSSLQKEVNTIMLSLVLICTIAIILYVLNISQIEPSTTKLFIGSVTLFSLIVPQTLIFMFSFNYIISLVRLQKKNVLIQQTNAMEILAHVDLVCFDKTGTLTTNKTSVTQIETFGEDELLPIIHSIFTNLASQNKTTEAMLRFLEKYPLHHFKIINQEPFSSTSKTAEMEFTAGKKEYRAVIGAPEKIKLPAKVKTIVAESQMKGQRVLLVLLQQKKQKEKFFIIKMEEEINPNAAAIIKSFKNEGVAIKILSGDAVETVTAIAAKVGINVTSKGVIYSRISPQEKAELIKTFKKTHIVAMVGDGVNDVLALKYADVGIAMKDGSTMANQVADIILINNDFAVVPDLIHEGKNIILNIYLAASFFFSKSIFALGLVINSIVFKINGIFDLGILQVVGFFGVSVPAYVVSFGRAHIARHPSVKKLILIIAIPVAALQFLVLLGITYLYSLADVVGNPVELILRDVQWFYLFSSLLIFLAIAVNRLQKKWIYFVIILVVILILYLAMNIPFFNPLFDN